MFRTADAFAIDKIFLCGYTATPPKPQIDKVALGAEQWIPWEKCEDTIALIKRLQKESIKVIAIEKNEQSLPITSYDFSGDVALVFGHEVDGVSDEVLAVVNDVVHIPMQGKKESLNVSIAAGIAMFCLRHQGKRTI